MASGAGERIEDFIAVLERAGRNPGVRESFHVVCAIEAVSAGFTSLAERDIDRAIRPPRKLNFLYRKNRPLPPVTEKPLTTAELRLLWENNRRR